jgi:hypothetical protein
MPPINRTTLSEITKHFGSLRVAGRLHGLNCAGTTDAEAMARSAKLLKPGWADESMIGLVRDGALRCG